MAFSVFWLGLILSWHTSLVASAGCPWQETGLLNWNDPKTWDSGKVPADGDRVVIPTGKRVLLNAQPASLGTLEVKSGAALIWGDLDGLVLSTHHILVRGEFHIGSESCRFVKKARIRLLGTTADEFNVDEEDFGRKFIGVAPGGVLELHGKKKTSWTKLAQTVHPVSQLDCALVYNHQKSLFGLERQTGLHVIVWNEAGTIMDFSVFKQIYDNFGSFFNTIPNGKVVAMVAYGDGMGSNVSVVVPTIQSLGGSLIAKVGNGDSYSFIAKKGQPGTVKEFTKVNGQLYPAPTGYLHLQDPRSGLVFQVSSSATELFQQFRVLQEDAAYPILTLTEEAEGWQPGDEILLTSTDFDWHQAETVKILPCEKCSLRQVRVNDSFEYMHYGNFTYNVDERGEVAMLSRNILIEGIMEDSCYSNDARDTLLCQTFNIDTFGGHLKVVKGHKAVHIRGVELYHMGQQRRMGVYPLHFHLVDDAPGMYLRENTVHHSFSRCITCHGTNYLDISDNVCWRHLGHGMFIEDGVEQNNTYRHNLVGGTQFGTLLMSDMSMDYCKANGLAEWAVSCGDLSSYWITHPNNYFEGNVAAGSDVHGFMLVFADLPLGPSRERQRVLGRPHHPRDIPLAGFTKNVAHSNDLIGVFMDSKISTGTGIEDKGMIPENGVIQSANEYFPMLDGKPVWVELSYGTYYKNGNQNLWIKGGNVRLSYSSIADSPEGVSGGTTLFDTGMAIYKSLFIGETENTGSDNKMVFMYNNMRVSYSFGQSFDGLPQETLTAVGLYQGPILVVGNYFDKFDTRSWCLNNAPTCPADQRLTRHAGAISFKRSNNYPTMTSSYVAQNSFGFCDNVDGHHHVFQGHWSLIDWPWKDGNLMVFFSDKDGKLTGGVNSSVVPDIQLYKGPECLEKPDWGSLMVCPYRYVKLELLGTGGNLEGSIKDNYAMMIKRDDPGYDEVFSIQGEIRNEYLLRTHRSYLIDFNATNANAAFPDAYRLYGYGVERQDVVRVGICQPLDVQGFIVNSDYPVAISNTPLWVNSLQDLDADTTGRALFHDKTNGILFFKMTSIDSDTNETQKCPDGKCWNLKVTLIGGSRKLRSCFGVQVPPYQDKNVYPPKTTIPACRVEQRQDQGAVKWDEVDFVVQKIYSVPCLNNRPTRQSAALYLGCYREKVNMARGLYQKDLIDKEQTELIFAMTVDFCIERCSGRGYVYAGLSRGRRCTCGNVVETGISYVAPAGSCSYACGGQASQTCGSALYIDVWKTGV